VEDINQHILDNEIIVNFLYGIYSKSIFMKYSYYVSKVLQFTIEFAIFQWTMILSLV
jgi:hypothetical protein